MASRAETLPRTTIVARLDALRRRPVRLAIALIALLAVALVVGVGAGSVAIPPTQSLEVVIGHLLGVGAAVPEAIDTIVWELRVPRVLMAAVVGAGLGVAGATFQGLLRNPLADPYVLGTASGAALGAAIAILIPVRLVILEFGLVNGLAFVGALVAVWAVYRLSRTSGLSPLTSLLLTGYAVGSLLAAGLALAMYASGAHLRQIFAFLLGGLEGASWSRLAGATLLIGIAIAAASWRTRALNGFILGEETAAHLGVDVPRERAILFAIGSLATAAAVAVAGLIGFVGLVVPHLVRLVVGPNARIVVPLSALGGALLLVVADVISRLSGEIPIGVVTALIGAPFFIVILRRARTGYEL
ncbi:MAG TPA: iron ABC transporter permease [Candidatus Limnocylindrales bacterium]|nr:iron ABC transporter permease [Candidatus Limnocylindrales bacterium]